MTQSGAWSGAGAFGGSAIAVPEPSSLVLLAVSIAAYAAARRL